MSMNNSMNNQEQLSLIQQKKDELMNTLNKEQLVEIIFQNNNLHLQQTVQLLDMIDLNKKINQLRESDKKKCDSTLEHTTHQHEERIDIYETSIRIQFMLIFLFVIVLMYLYYKIK